MFIPQSAKGADARRGINKQHLTPLRGAPEAAPVLHVHLRTHE